MKRLFIVLCFVLRYAAVLAQQDAQYSQYIFNGLYINPAYAGYKQDFYLQSFYRSQWTGFTGAPTSYSVAADGSVNDTKVGLGLLLAGDNIGAQKSLAADFSYAYHIQVGQDENTRLSFGLGLGLALSRQTLLDHGGDMWADANGPGARFCLRLPKEAR